MKCLNKKYAVVSKIGEGGIEIYRIKDLSNDKNYIAKTYNIFENDDDKDTKKAFLQKINVISKLIHPSLLEFIDYLPIDFEGNKVTTIITEFAPNGSLLDLIRMESKGQAPDNWTQTKKLINIYGIASGISYLHSLNLIHRNLCPENVLLDERFYPKLKDFAFKEIIDLIGNSLMATAHSASTPLYLAPEVLDDGEKYSPKSDVYSFAYIVYLIFHLKLPIKKLNAFKIMSDTLEGKRPKIDASVPLVYRNLIERCWAADPDNRPSFDSIVDEIKSNHEFITDEIDENEFFDYVEFLDNSK